MPSIQIRNQQEALQNVAPLAGSHVTPWVSKITSNFEWYIEKEVNYEHEMLLAIVSHIGYL